MPPVHVGVAVVHVPPLPVTTSLPLALAVVFSTIPLAAPLDEMLRKVRSSAPMVVLTTLSAVPVVVVRVLSGAVPTPLVSVTTTVPPPVALNAVLPPVDAVEPAVEPDGGRRAVAGDVDPDPVCR